MAPENRPLTGESRNLDVLRALAVVLVVVAHVVLTYFTRSELDAANRVVSFPASDLPEIKLLYLATRFAARLGVLLFFVHTAVVLLMSLDRTEPNRLFLQFYVRRISRIYPLSVVCIITVVLFRIPIVPAVEYIVLPWRDILANVFLVQNVTNSPDVLAPLWSLPWEIQMYTVLPVLYCAVRRIDSRAFVPILWLAMVAVSQYVQLLYFAPCFLGGVFAYQLSRRVRPQLPGNCWLPALAAIVLLYVPLKFLTFQAADYIICMLLGWLVPHVEHMNASWVTRSSRTVAKYSYGLYLFHVPLIWATSVKLDWPAPLRWGAFVALVGAVPWIAYHCIEAPMIEAGRRLSRALAQPKLRKNPDARVAAAQN
jgi:peptidoglycan/LPS O-acetylase OafA/YrhL